jgi:hypothetical protein
MSAPRLSIKQKNEIVQMYHAGQAREAAAKHGVDPTYPCILARRRETKKLSPRQKRRIESLDRPREMNHGE